MHRLSVIEKLRERMGDEDKIVRETLYQLLKAVIFPECKEENQGTFISLMMAYVFNAMTHLPIDVRLMAFKFFDLVVQHYPVSFSMYAEKIIQCSDPAPECQTMVLKHASLSPGRNCQANVSQGDKTGTTSNELDLLFSPMFDELLNGSTKVVSKSSAVSTADAPNQCQQPSVPLNTHTTPAPTCPNPPISTFVISSENITQAEPHAENDEVADDEFISIFSTPVQDQGETSSRHVDSSNMHTFYQRYPSEQRWTKDHPLEQVIGNPSQSVRTRRQLESDAEMCMFALTVSRIQSHKTSDSNKPIDQKSHTQTPGRQIFTGHKFSTNKSFAMYKKTSPRSDLRWKPTVQNSSDPGPTCHSMASVQNSFDPSPTCHSMASVQNSTDPGPTRHSMASVQNSSDPGPTCHSMASVQNSTDPGPTRHSMASVQNSTDPAPTRHSMASAHNSSDPAPTCHKMASVQISSDPAPDCQTMVLEHGSLSPE
nr:armadillo-like helical [Tanacetum cinerariifolium]